MKKIQLFLLQGLLSSVPLYTLTAQTTTPSTHYAVETGIVAGHGDYSPAFHVKCLPNACEWKIPARRYPFSVFTEDKPCRLAVNQNGL